MRHDVLPVAGDVEPARDVAHQRGRRRELGRGERILRGETGVLDGLARRFEKALIMKALAHTGGRRIEASQLLGLGRNTLTRKIQELGIDSDKKSE